MVERDRVAVVIVEDDPSFRERFEQMLSQSNGYRVLAAGEKGGGRTCHLHDLSR